MENRKVTDTILQNVEVLSGTLREIRKQIHLYPESSFSESKTSNLISSKLKEEGFKIVSFGVHHSFAAIFESGHSSKTIAVRAELDALPITEDSGNRIVSKVDGVMHACGHDIHMAAVLGAGLLLKSMKEEWSGRLILIFESGEELLPGGASAIVATDVFKELNIDFMLAAHVLPELPLGKVGFCLGKYMASGDEVYLTVHGKGGHAALPYALIDPVVISVQIVNALQTLVSRNANQNIPTVLSFGRIEANGATNVIPDKVDLQGTFRTMDENWRGEAHGLITRMAKGVAESMGGSCDVEIRKGYPSVYNNPQLVEKVKLACTVIFGKDNVVTLEPRMTTDDFAYFSQQVPSVLFRVGVGEDGKSTQLHRSNFDPDEKAIDIAMKGLGIMLLDLLK